MGDIDWSDHIMEKELCYFTIEKSDFDRFLAALDKAPVDNDRLRQTLALTPPWEK